MPSTTSFEFGDIVLVPFPFTDQRATKKRPAVVVSSVVYNASRPDLIVLAITSQSGPTKGVSEAAALSADDDTQQIAERTPVRGCELAEPPQDQTLFERGEKGLEDGWLQQAGRPPVPNRGTAGRHRLPPSSRLLRRFSPRTSPFTAPFRPRKCLAKAF
jgi:mRNA-degrading endonuclease toxin of MazEF toxin-antitoxin module